MRWISGEITSANPGLHFILGLAVHILTIAKVVACLLKLSIHIEVFLLLDYLALSRINTNYRRQLNAIKVHPED